MINSILKRQESDYRDFSTDLYNFRDEILKLVPKDAHILDVGCANGWFLEWLKNHGYENTEGIDIVKKAIDETLAREMRATLMDAHQTNFNDNTFEAITMSHVLEHSPLPNIFMKEMCRIIKPNGYVFIEVPLQSVWTNEGGHFTFFESIDEFIKFISDFNIEIIVKNIDGYDGYTNHRWIVGKVIK